MQAGRDVGGEMQASNERPAEASTHIHNHLLFDVFSRQFGLLSNNASLYQCFYGAKLRSVLIFVLQLLDLPSVLFLSLPSPFFFSFIFQRFKQKDSFKEIIFGILI